jgi:hypothetical protein
MLLSKGAGPALDGRRPNERTTWGFLLMRRGTRKGWPRGVRHLHGTAPAWGLNWALHALV